MILFCLRWLYFVSKYVISSFLIASFIIVKFISGRILALKSQWHCLHSKVGGRRCRFCRSFTYCFTSSISLLVALKLLVSLVREHSHFVRYCSHVSNDLGSHPVAFSVALSWSFFPSKRTILWPVARSEIAGL